MNKKQIKISLILNSVISFLVLLGTFFMVTGIKFMSQTETLSSTGFNPLKFYTVDSNILVGIASLILVIYEISLLKNKKEYIPKIVYLLKYIATVAVSLTFIVTLLYLVPLYGSNFMYLYQNSNLFFHLIVPILSVISYILFEKNDMKFSYTFYGTSTMIVYGLYYATNVLLHQIDGKVTYEYDWYGFVQGGVSLMIIVIPIMFIVTYLISFILYKLNKKVG